MLVPSSLLEFTKLDMIPQIKNAVGTKIILIIGHLSNLRANIHTQTLTDPQEILGAACAIEADLLAWWLRCHRILHIVAIHSCR